MFSDHDETSPSIAVVLVPSAACSILAVQQGSVANSSTCPLLYHAGFQFLGRLPTLKPLMGTFIPQTPSFAPAPVTEFIMPLYI